MRKSFYSFLSIFVTVIIFSNVLLYIKQPSFVFYPQKKIEVSPKDWGLDYESVKLKLEDNVKISGWYIPHPVAEKTILFFHGNGGNISHRGDSIYIFHKLKFNILIIDYAGYGESEGTVSEKSMYQSAEAAWQYLINNKNTVPESIIIFGRSLGGAVAVDLASKVKAGGLILESTFSSLRDIVEIHFSKWSKLIYLRYVFDSFDKIKKVTFPVLVIHSPDDEVIPFQLGQTLFENIESEKTFLKIQGGHNDGFMQSIGYYMPSIRRFAQSIDKTN